MPTVSTLPVTTSASAVVVMASAGIAVGAMNNEKIFETVLFGPDAVTVKVPLNPPFGVPDSSPAEPIVSPNPGDPVQLHGDPQSGAENSVEYADPTAPAGNSALVVIANGSTVMLKEFVIDADVVKSVS